MSGDVAAYIRVSSDKQDTTRQRESVEAAAQQLGFTIDHWFQDSEGKNSRDLPHKRVAFKRMMAAVERRELKLVIVDSQDRFGTRDAAQFGSFITHFRDNGCSLFDATGRDFSADDDGAVLTTTIGALTSTREQREKGRRCLGGMVEHAKQGHYVGGYPPFGMDVVCFGSDGQEKWRSLYVGHFDRWKVYPNGTREHYKGKDNAPQKDREDVFHYRPSIESGRLQVVRDIFRWYATEAISPRQIATRLNDLKVKPIFGERWDKVKILQLLRNPVYIGRPKWNKRAGSRFVEFVGGRIRDIPRSMGIKMGRPRDAVDQIGLDKPQFDPIVDRKTWDAVQKKIHDASDKQRAVPKRPPQTAELWLKPFLICGHCNKPMRATRGGQGRMAWPSYFCGTYGTHGAKNPTGCHCHRIKHDQIEKLLAAYIAEKMPAAHQMLKAANGSASGRIQELYDDCDPQSHDHLAVEMEVFIREHHPGGKRLKLDTHDDCRKHIDEALAAARQKLGPIIAAKEAELDRMLDDFRSLAPVLRERANAKMEAAQKEIDALKRELRDFAPSTTNHVSNWPPAVWRSRKQKRRSSTGAPVVKRQRS